jgi:hypothetical protein
MTTTHATRFAIDTRDGAPTFAQLSGRVANLEAKAAAYREAGADARHLRPILRALASAEADLDAAL